MSKPPTAEQLTAQCARWNAANPVGTAVTVRMDSGELRETTTRSEAQILGAEPSKGYIGHTAVIWLDGISGCYLLDRVTPKPCRVPLQIQVETFTEKYGPKSPAKFHHFVNELRHLMNEYADEAIQTGQLPDAEFHQCPRKDI